MAHLVLADPNKVRQKGLGSTVMVVVHLTAVDELGGLGYLVLTSKEDTMEKMLVTGGAPGAMVRSRQGVPGLEMGS